MRVTRSICDTDRDWYQFSRKLCHTGSAAFIPDVMNTWTEDSGNTNFKRLQKTGIQMAGAAVSFGVGYVSGKVFTWIAPNNFIAGVVAAEPLNLGGAYLIQWMQYGAYEALDIR